jgi:3-hydroxymyristoyl/3-hydroxydecanoyl-(acyl carrier protein) dehydratase
MENNFCKNELIDKCHIILLPGSEVMMGCVLLLTQAGKQFLKSSGHKELLKQINKFILKYYAPSMLPKKYRVINEIPVNPQGKFVNSEIIKLFDSKIPEPLMDNLIVNENLVSMDLTFIKDSIYFQGHFPDFPILPGVIQYYFVEYYMRFYWNEKRNICKMKKLKFTKMIFPNETVQLILEKNDASYIFKYLKNDEVCSSGIMELN